MNIKIFWYGLKACWSTSSLSQTGISDCYSQFPCFLTYTLPIPPPKSLLLVKIDLSFHFSFLSPFSGKNYCPFLWSKATPQVQCFFLFVFLPRKFTFFMLERNERLETKPHTIVHSAITKEVTFHHYLRQMCVCVCLI